MVLTETKLEKEEERHFEDYKGIFLNNNSAAGGVTILHKREIKLEEIKRNLASQILWVEIKGKNKKDQIILGGIYSPCENITKKNEIKKITNSLDNDIKELTRQSASIILVGDMNAHIGDDELGVKGNNPKIGVNGHHYRELIKENDLIIANNTDKCTGLWTRIENDKKSVLDLTITNKKAYEKILSIEIDSNSKYCFESKRGKTDHKVTIIKIDACAKLQNTVPKTCYVRR